MESEILRSVSNHVGVLTLNRPAVLNALSYTMVQEMTAQLDDWAHDDSVHAVLVRGAGGKAFCAGGDIRALYESYRNHSSLHREYFVAEYRLDYRTHRYPKPYVALIDGIVMGGGVGISQGACLRIATDRMRFAMPETGIGLFPDVGASHFLARMAPELELYVGVTGRNLLAADALYCGLADAYLPPEGVARLDDALGAIRWGSDHRRDVLDAILPLGRRSLPDPPLLGLQPAIARHFANGSIGAIMDSLSNEDRPEYGEWAKQTLASMKKRSPLMMCVTMRQLQIGRDLPLADCFRMELGIVHHCFEHGDFIEGVRSLIIDKDNHQRWKPPHIEDVTEAMVDAFFEDPWSESRHPLADLGEQSQSR